jgi:hypothetical protein
MHDKQQSDDRVVGIFARQEAGDQLGPSERLFEGPLKTIEKSTSAKGRLAGEDVGFILPYSKEGFERTQEYWEGYDPGMDAGF